MIPSGADETSPSAEITFPETDYVSPGLARVKPDAAFPHLSVGDPSVNPWPYLRREIPHTFYVDRRCPGIGFVSRDEAHLLYNNALQFRGRKALEIGCWLGWSACHVALANVDLDCVDPLLGNAEIRQSVMESLAAAARAFRLSSQVTLCAGASPGMVEELALQRGRWSFIFIDGDHEAPSPLNDAITCERFVEADAMIVFHDLAAPAVAAGLDYLRQRGWDTRVYQTAQIMGVAWRGNVRPVEHAPDPRIRWSLPAHLAGYTMGGAFAASE